MVQGVGSPHLRGAQLSMGGLQQKEAWASSIGSWGGGGIVIEEGNRETKKKKENKTEKGGRERVACRS